jgi:hypothetical protein
LRVLLVEDESRLAETVRRGLAAEGFVVDVEQDGVDGWAAAGEIYSAGPKLGVLGKGPPQRLLCHPAPLPAHPVRHHFKNRIQRTFYVGTRIGPR